MDEGLHNPLTLDALPPSALHVLECADGTLRHSTGMRALGALRALALLAPERMDKPGFAEKLKAARDGAALARQECDAFLKTSLLHGTRVADLFPSERDLVVVGLDGLDGLSTDQLPARIESAMAALQGITRAIQAARRSVRSFVDDEVPRLAGLCEADRARFVTRIAPADDRLLFFDPQRLRDALAELVSNALKHAFHGQGGTVRLEVAEGASQNEVLLSVSDDGGGISPEVQPRLFERGASTRGSGEGLALVREIIETEHLGQLTYMTGPRGTRWEIILPVKIPRGQLSQVASSVAASLPVAESPPQIRKPRWRNVALIAAILTALVVLAWAGWPLLSKRRATPPTPAPPAAEPVWSSSPGRVPEGCKAVPNAGSHIGTGWARDVMHEKTGITLVLVPAGEFIMGRDDGDVEEAPAHRVRITKPFYLGKTEVTQTQYRKLMGDNPSRFKGDDLPVERVSFVDVAMFNAQAGLRLPSEAEWEFAARGSAAVPGEKQRTVPVASSAPNDLGLCGMLGNVAEWCSDWYDLYAPGDTVDPRGPKRGDRWVVRGGSFLSDPVQLRITQRSSLGPMEKWDFVGFRVALDVPTVPPASSVEK